MSDKQIKALQEKNVLAAGWSEDDGWYGKNYRLILSASETDGFKNAKEAKKLKGEFARYATARSRQKIAAKQISFNKLSSYQTYIYCSMGPSYSCAHYHITVNELNEWSSKNPRLKDMEPWQAHQIKEERRKARRLAKK